MLRRSALTIRLGLFCRPVLIAYSMTRMAPNSPAVSETYGDGSRADVAVSNWLSGDCNLSAPVFVPPFQSAPHSQYRNATSTSVPMLTVPYAVRWRSCSQCACKSDCLDERKPVRWYQVAKNIGDRQSACKALVVWNGGNLGCPCR